MRRHILWALTLCSLGLILSGIGLLALATPVTAQDTVVIQDIPLESANYVGVGECALCHRNVLRDHRQTRHSMTLRDVANTRLILGAFDQGDDTRTVQFPDEDSPRAFSAADIRFALGTGKNVQRYVYQADLDTFLVLPAQWNVNTQSWERYGPDEAWPSDAFDFGRNCAGCHTTNLDSQDFYWGDNGVQCESCHGPGSLHVEAAQEELDLATIRASIVMSPDPQICGQCHSRGVEPDTGLPFPIDYRPGQGDLLAEDVFVLVAPDDEAHWWPSGHARDKYMQFNESLLSAHSTALADMQESEFAEESCLTCHSGDYRWNMDLIALHEEGARAGDPPHPVTVESAAFGITCANCHASHGSAEQPAQLREEPYAMCASCHQNPPEHDRIHYPAREMFEGIQLVANIDAMPSGHFTDLNGPRCATCHMPDIPVEQAGTRDSHLWEPVIPGTVAGLQDSCTTCHTEFVDADGINQLISTIQNSTHERIETAQAALTDAHPEWVGQAIRFVENDGSGGIHNYAYANALLRAAEVEMGLTTSAVSEPDLSAFGDAPIPPDVQTAGTPFTPLTFGSGLTLPSIILLGIAGLIIGVAAYAFFLRRP